MEKVLLGRSWMIALLACLLLVIQLTSGYVPAAKAAESPTLAKQSLQKASSAFLGSVSNTDDSNAMIRYFTEQPSSSQYIQEVKSEVQGNQGNYSSSNDLSKRVIGWTSTGQDATNVVGINLIQKLSAFPLDTEGVWNNQLIWRLIAFDTKGYSLPADAVSTRQSLISSILQSQVASGGWDLVVRHNGSWQKPLTYDSNYNPETYGIPTSLDIDTTGMALTALAPYQSDTSVSESVYQAVYQLKSATPTNSDSLSQMIIGLSAVGVDPTTFNNQNLVQQLLTYQLADGMFKYDDSSWGSQPNAYATNDALTALSAYLRFSKTNTASPIYYHMTGYYRDHLQQASNAFLANDEVTDDSNAIIRYFTGQPASSQYIQNVQSEVQGNKGDYSSYNTLAKRIMGWTAAGQDATNVSGINLIQKLGSFPIDTEGRWNNELISGLMAIDSKGYNLSADAVISRDSLISSIIQSQVNTGGWDLVIRHDGAWKKPTSYDSNYKPTAYGTATNLDIDMTGMALTALAPYQSQSSVLDAINRAVSQLKYATPTNCDSLSQMIIGLSAVGVDPSDFNNLNLVQQLLSYQLDGGMFKYDDSSWGSNPNAYATNDALTALLAYQKFAENRKASPIYYQMSGVSQLPDSGTNSGSSNNQNPQQTGSVTISVTGDNQHGTILPSTSISLQSGDTAYSVLVKALGASRIKYKSYSGSIYVQGIDGLSEFDKGPQSGWIFFVDGQQSQISASDYRLNNGDRLEWKYTGEETPANLSNTTKLDSAFKSLSLSYDNHQPISQVQKTVVVLNSDQRMDPKTTQQIAQLIQGSKVNLSQQVTPTTAATLTDTNQIVSLAIPEQALKQSTDIQVQQLNTESRKEVLSPMYEFMPKGQTFEKPIDISIKVPLTTEDLSQIAMAWLNEETNEWVPIPAVVDAKTGIVTGRVNHFTKFAVINRNQLDGKPVEVDKAMDLAVRNVLQSTDLSEWGAFGLARAEKPVPSSYLSSVNQLLEQNQGSFRKITDYERLVLGVTAAGGDPLHVSGVNLLEKIYNNDRLTLQGTNGVIFALIALDSKNYQVPSDALWNRDKLVDWLLKNQNQDGGWSLVSGDSSDLDLTSMALVGLAPYKSRADVKKAIDSALGWIVNSSQQSVPYSESIAQEIQGLAALGINPMDPKFNRDGKDLISYLVQFQLPDGGYVHQEGKEADRMATEQALLALDAYQYYVKGKGSIYQFSSKTNMEYTDRNEISDWALESVKKAKEYGLMQGVSSSTFAPKEPVTRAQFASVMLRLLGKQGIANQDNKESTFTDVQPGDWYYNDVRTAKELGIIHGVSSSSFAPNAPISREQMAVMIANAYQLQPANQSFQFADQDEIDAYALTSLQALHEKGLLVGYSDGIQPLGEATREMVAALAVRLYEENHK